MKRLIFSLLIASALRATSVLALPTDGLTELNGGTVTVSPQATTELVIFWATWCPDCKKKLTKDIPSLRNELQKNPDLSIVTVNTEKEVDRVKNFVTKEGIGLPVFLDPEKKLRKALGVYSVPAWAVYKRKSVSEGWALVDTAPAFENARINKALGRVLFK